MPSGGFTQLDPPLPLDTTTKGPGWAVAVIDYGPEHHLYWVVFLDDSREVWVVPNPEVRAQVNWTLGRRARP